MGSRLAGHAPVRSKYEKAIRPPTLFPKYKPCRLQPYGTREQPGDWPANGHRSTTGVNADSPRHTRQEHYQPYQAVNWLRPEPPSEQDRSNGRLWTQIDGNAEEKPAQLSRTASSRAILS